MAGALLAGGRAMSAMFYLLIGIVAFGAFYVICGLAVAIGRLTRYRPVAGEGSRAQHRRRAF
jgi:hypothetical protein